MTFDTMGYICSVFVEFSSGLHITKPIKFPCLGFSVLGVRVEINKKSSF
jgi:hypothetical protein